MRKESDFQTDVRKSLEGIGCMVFKMEQNATTRRGTPDLLFIHGKQYGFLECKRKKPAPSDFQPLQEMKVKILNEMSFARVTYPENWDTVFKDIREFLSE